MDFKLPADWDEIISGDAYQAVIRTLLKEYPDKESAYVAMFKVLTETNLENDIPLGDSAGQLAVAMQIKEEIFPMLDFIFDRKPFYTQPIPSFKHLDNYYKGPEKYLANQTGAEWAISHHAMFLFNKTNNVSYLRTLIAANYHQMANGERTDFDEKTFEKDMEAFKGLPDWLLHGFALWYNHADEFWMIKYPDVFESEGEVPAQKPDGTEVRKILFELAGNSLGEAWDKVQQRNRQDLMFALDRLEKRRQPEAK
jgi:hypothetical protein